MSKLTKQTQSMRERALAEIEKKSSAAREAPADAQKPRRGAVRRFERGGSLPDIFSDADVCRLLGKNRRYLIRARKAKARGEDWDVISHHAGMTASWILRENPKADLEQVVPWRIKPGDGIVSVEVVQHTLDCRKLACRRLSDGAIVVVQVDDASRFLDGEQFDAQELAGTYRWNASLNRS